MEGNECLINSIESSEDLLSIYNKIEFINFLKTINDKNFFCYNNRKDSKEFIENEILSHLPSNVEIIYLDGKKPVSKFNKKKYHLYCID